MKGNRFTGNRGQDLSDRLPTEETNNPFYITHSPMGWDVLKTGKVWSILPSLGALPQAAGMNGMGMRPGGGVDDMLAKAKLRSEKGFTILEMDYDGGYLQKYKNKHGQPIYKDIWTTPKLIGSTLRWITDDAAVNKFKQSLLDNGVIALPDEIIIEDLKERIQRRIDSRVKEALVNPDVATRKKDYETMLAGIDKAFQAMMNPKKQKVINAN